jgi:hypothetical protein
LKSYNLLKTTNYDSTFVQVKLSLFALRIFIKSIRWSGFYPYILIPLQIISIKDSEVCGR